MERRSPIPAKITRGSPPKITSGSDITKSLAGQMVARLARPTVKKPEYEGTDTVVSTGSTLLDLAISGGRFPYGGIPGGILVEIFGPSSAGKTVLLCELAGTVQRMGGEVMFRDPEGRLNSQFAQMFDFKVENAHYGMPNTVTELFKPIREWKPDNDSPINAAFADSLAALSTAMEMDDADKYGMRRAKEFSEECRKICRVLTERGILMVCSNQVRQNLDAGPYGEKYKSPGGEAIGFYASLRLRAHSPQKIQIKRDVMGKEQSRVIGVKTTIDVYKSSVWMPHRSAPINILYDYGIDDVRGNVQYLKDTLGGTRYVLDNMILGQSIERAIRTVEDSGLESKLRDKVIEVWHDVESKFKIERKPKRPEISQ